ncbi:MAG: hypothetical protein U5P41_07305 [Gammaproteobacteria bacterium]|nr:hypothetical protein [Gammaproteobacteria bacterium]
MLDDAIRELYQSRPEKGCIYAFAKKWGYPRWWISKRARDLGFVSPRLSEPPWSEAEDELLGQHSHKTLSVIQRIFKSHGYTRSETAINVRRKRLHLNVRDPDRFTATQLARILGLDSKSVTRWIHLDMLPAEHRGTARTELQGGDMFWIRRDDVREFIRNNPERIDLRKVEKHMFIELLLGGGAQ